MSIPDKFSSFCSSLRMSDNVVSNVSSRAKRITKQVNYDFRSIGSEDYSLYMGSYGRGTAIHVSDIDMIIELPISVYYQYNTYYSNGQSALLQALKNSIKRTYSSTEMAGDGQVVKVEFYDGIIYEVLPGFKNNDGSYTYPDTHNGGSWKITNPRAEINEINSLNFICNKNLKRLCRIARAWKDNWNVPIGGLLIDTFSYNFLKSWCHRDKSYLYYDYLTRDFFEYLSAQNPNQNYWLAPGSNQYVWRKGSFEYKALRCFNLAKEAIRYEEAKLEWSANQKWREIYGTRFPT